MKRFASLLIVLLVGASAAWAQILTMSPQTPTAGETVVFTYNPEAPGATIGDAESVFLVDHGRRAEYNERIPMRKTRNGWTVRYETYEDMSRGSVLSVETADGQVDNNGGQYWELHVLDEEGKSSLSWIGYLKADLMPEGTDINALRAGYAMAELAQDPENRSLQIGVWRAQVRQGLDIAPLQEAARAMAAEVLAEDPESMENYSLAYNALNTVKLNEEADALEARYKADPPNIEFEARFARSDFGRLLTEEKDPLKKIATLEGYLEQYGDVSSGWEDETLGEMYAGRLLTFYIEAEDAEGIARLAEEVDFDDMYGRASLQLREIAVALARTGDTELAQTYIRRAEKVEKAEYDYESMRAISRTPFRSRVMYGKEDQAEAFLAKVAAENDAARGFILAKAGDVDRGVRLVLEAESLLEESVEGLMLVGETLAMADRHAEAFDRFESVAMLSPGHPEARGALKSSWIAWKGSDAGYYDAVAAIESAWRVQRAAELVAERGSDLAPAFQTTLLASGETISRDDLRGKVVVLDFWATWCGPCLRAFPDLQKTYEKYKNNPRVAFLVVNTGWSNTIEDAQEFAAERDYTFPYTMDHNEVMTSAFKVSGIPTTVVLDAEGREAFRHLGYSGPDYVAELSLELDLLLGDYVVVAEATGDGD